MQTDTGLGRHQCPPRDSERKEAKRMSQPAPCFLRSRLPRCDRLGRHGHRESAHLRIAGETGSSAAAEHFAAETPAKKYASILLALTMYVVSTASAEAQNVAAQISSREGYVGQPLVLQVQVSNAPDFKAPVVPAVDGLDIKLTGAPSRSSQVSIINGRRSERTSTTFSYHVTPRRIGTFTIPPIPVVIDGRTQSTQEFRFVVAKSETGDLMFVEMTSENERVYVGQEIRLKLKVWIRPFVDRELRIKLNDSNMWQLIADTTKWGPFEERIVELANLNQRPSGEEVLREDENGVSHAYYLYELEATLYPQRPGTVEVEDTQIVVTYPTALGRARSRFGSIFGDDDFFSAFGDPFGGRRIAISSHRPITADAQVPPVTVVDVPTEGRPSNYRGAVGTYKIHTQANPTNVSAGDPITLQIVLQGDGPMELVQAPPLSSMSGFLQSFKVADDALAGFVQDDAKLFTTSIRPLHADVTEIPSVSFSFFDPEREEFRTVQSEPIAITVSEADTLSLDSIVGARREQPAPQHEPEEAQTSGRSQWSNYSAEQVLESETEPQRIPLFTFAMAPAFCALCIIARLGQWVRVSRFSGQQSIPTIIRSVRRASSASQIAQLLTSLASARSTPELQNALSRCNAAAYSPSGDSLDALKSVAIDALREYQDTPSPRTTARAAIPASTSGALLLLTLTCGQLLDEGQVRATTGAPDSTTTLVASDSKLKPSSFLTSSQKRILLQEANEIYTAALAEEEPDATRFAVAAAKYQLVADSGLLTPKLFFNLGNAYLKASEPSLALANFEQALRLSPLDTMTHHQLAAARSELDDAERTNTSGGLSRLVTQAVRLNDFVPIQASFVATALGWSSTWCLVGLGILRRRIPFVRAIVVVSLFSLVVGAGSLAVHHVAKFDAIAIADDLTVRQSDGETFPEVGESHQGEHLRVLQRRAGWVQVESTTRQLTGWVPERGIFRLRG